MARNNLQRPPNLPQKGGPSPLKPPVKYPRPEPPPTGFIRLTTHPGNPSLTNAQLMAKTIGQRNRNRRNGTPVAHRSYFPPSVGSLASAASAKAGLPQGSSWVGEAPVTITGSV
jgi:hypothetical protein